MDRDTKSYYAWLHLSPDASMEEVKLSWRRLSKELHPDGEQDQETKAWKEERQKELNAAYDVLSDSSKRWLYDPAWKSGAPSSTASAGQQTQSTPQWNQRPSSTPPPKPPPRQSQAPPRSSTRPPGQGATSPSGGTTPPKPQWQRRPSTTTQATSQPAQKPPPAKRPSKPGAFVKQLWYTIWVMILAWLFVNEFIFMFFMYPSTQSNLGRWTEIIILEGIAGYLSWQPKSRKTVVVFILCGLAAVGLVSRVTAHSNSASSGHTTSQSGSDTSSPSPVVTKPCVPIETKTWKPSSGVGDSFNLTSSLEVYRSNFHIAARDRSTGQQLWVLPDYIHQYLDEYEYAFIPGAIIRAHGTSEDAFGDLNGEETISLLNATRKVQWSRSTSIPLSFVPGGYNRKALLFGVTNSKWNVSRGDIGIITALDRKTGAKLWSTKTWWPDEVVPVGNWWLLIEEFSANYLSITNNYFNGFVVAVINSKTGETKRVRFGQANHGLLSQFKPLEILETRTGKNPQVVLDTSDNGKWRINLRTATAVPGQPDNCVG